ncbi:MAG: response regulator [Acidobacteria bacterium]|nr:response regulator [Acidobacteriota bacterium]
MLGVLMHVGRARGLEIVGARSIDEVGAALDARQFGVLVADLRLSTASGLDVIKKVREHDPSIEAIVISTDRRLSSALESYERDIFAFVPKPFDPAQLFATVDRALERRKSVREHHRLTWELRLLNEVAALVSSSIEIGEALQTALERVAHAFNSRWATLRLVPIDGGAPVVQAAVGVAVATAEAHYAAAQCVWPSDSVMATGQPVRVDDIEPGTRPGVPAESELRSILLCARARGTGHALDAGRHVSVLASLLNR